MKNFTLLFTALIILITSSCKNVEKLVNQGRYEEAFELSIKELSKAKKKKTKHVKALERAYVKLNQENAREIAIKERSNNPYKYEDIINIYKQMESRQDLVLRYSPIVSKEGYEGYFEFTDYTPAIVDSERKSSDLLTNTATQLIDQAQSYNRYIAREAFDMLKISSRGYVSRETDSLMNIAYSLGHDHILFSLERSSHPLHHIVNSTLNTMPLNNMNNFWTTYHQIPSDEVIYNYEHI